MQKGSLLKVLVVNLIHRHMSEMIKSLLLLVACGYHQRNSVENKSHEMIFIFTPYQA